MVDLSSWFEQCEAVLTSGHTAVLAGPGSAKTATLVTKAAYLLAEKIPATRGLACITFNNEAADEFKSRLQALDVFRTSRNAA
jgi:DNA helicase-2/ATP-dependent DNA helicase PcrA